MASVPSSGRAVCCPDCGASDFVEDLASGDTICRACGLVLGERAVDTRAEWRSFADELGRTGSDPSRASRVDELLPSGGLGSDIATGGQPLQPYNGGEGGVGRLAQLHARSRLSQADRQVASGYDALEQLADLLDLPQNVRVKAHEVYSAFAAKREKLRFKQNVVETAVIYVACKEAGVPRTFRELARSTGLREKHIRKSYGLVRKVVVPKTDQAIAPTTAADLVSRFCSKLRLSHAVESLAATMAGQATELMPGKKPSSLAAGAILLAAELRGEPRSARDIAQVASIAPTTVSSVYKALQAAPALNLEPRSSSLER